MSKKITRTFTRTEETMNRYMKVMRERAESGIKTDCFLNYKDSLVKEFNHWVIIENEFPYDAIASVSHMIITKREIALDWQLLSKEEKEELNEIKETYLKQKYDVFWENFPSVQTVPQHFHIHLIVLKREDA